MPPQFKDTSRVGVTIIPPPPATSLGRGGGALEGDLELVEGFQAEISDPELGCDLSLTIGAHNRRLAIERAVFSLREEALPLTGTRLRSAPLDAYLQAVRQGLEDLGDRLLVRNQTPSPDAMVPYLTRPSEADWHRFEAEYRRNHRQSTPSPGGGRLPPRTGQPRSKGFSVADCRGRQTASPVQRACRQAGSHGT